MAVLEGDPQGEELFTVRFRVAERFVMPPHWHPRDERVTVLSGKVAVAFGEEAVRADAREFGPGDYYVNARHAVHQVWIEGPTVIQITGIGPWQAVPASVTPPADGDG
jgi:quercetin dioxygenase-like cupin family protein